MAQAVTLDISRVRDSLPKDFIFYLNSLREDHSELSICQSLLGAIERGAIDSTIFTIFLSWSKSPSVVTHCMNFPSSISVRRSGSSHFGKALRHPAKWASMWKAIGGTQGVVDYLAKISVNEVKFLAISIAKCRSGSKIPERQKCIEELLCALLPSHYPASTVQCREQRPVQAYYAVMVGACSEEFVATLLDTQDSSNPLFAKIRPMCLLKVHGALLQSRIWDAMNRKRNLHWGMGDCMNALCYKLSVGPRPSPKVSASMAFSMRALKLRLEGGVWPSGVREASVFLSLLRRCIKYRLPQEKLRDVFSLGLSLVEADKNLKGEFKSSTIWNEISTRWGRSPVQYEDLMVRALRLDLGGYEYYTSHNVMALSKKLKLNSNRIWELLRLCCLHVPRTVSGVVDLDTKCDLAPLRTQKWSIDLFYALEKEKAIRFLEMLQASCSMEDFVDGPIEISIISQSYSRKQGNVVLLLTMLRHDSPEAQVKVKETVDQFRKESAMSREQTDRASLACAAIKHSIASGNLDLYGETVIWLQRFVRDALTAQEVFGEPMVATIEGIDLLSGIPDPLPQNMTLEGVASSVEQANAILMTFHQSMLLAKREPSYRERDWQGVVKLFGAVFEKRATRTRAVQKYLVGPKNDVYAAIWEKTLAMLEIVDVKLVRRAHDPIMAVIATLPPTTVAGIAKSMLATGAERRKKKDRQPSDEPLEKLSYSTLLCVVNGDQPELAQQLVLETILDRPDASSLHRHFLSDSFMKSLTAKQAQEILLAFATAIGEKLEEQSYVRIGEVEAAPSAPPQSLVKVTTVKYLAQLLQEAPFISSDAAIEVLIELFKVSTHRDIRLATLESLLGLLRTLCSVPDENWRASPSVEKIMAAIETIIPVAGSINEHRPLREADWETAKATGKLPDVPERAPRFAPEHRLSPLMNAFAFAPGLEKLRTEFVSRFFIPIYRRSQQEQHRWNTLFLAKHRPTLKASDLPPAPVAPRLWIFLMKSYADLVPQSILDDYNQYIMMTISPPAPLRAFNEDLQRDGPQSLTPEVEHWLSIFDEVWSEAISAEKGTKFLVNLIHHKDIKSSIPNGITNTNVHKMILAHASLFLTEYHLNPKLWSNFTESLRSPSDSSDMPKYWLRDRGEKWQTNGRAILQDVVDLVEARKALLEKEGSSKRLPSVDRLKYQLLPYPLYPELQADLEEQCAVFAVELEKQMSGSLDGEAHVLKWPRVLEDATTVYQLLNTSEERLRVALSLGKLLHGRDQKSLALNFVKMGLVKSFVGQVCIKERYDIDGDILKALGAMLEEWLVHEDEDVREKAVDWQAGNSGLWSKVEKASS